MIHETNDKIIERYKELCYQLKRVANGKDIIACKKLPCATTIIDRFGSISELQKLSGVIINGELSGKLLKSEVERLLIKKRIERGKRLDYLEINNDTELPRTTYIRKLYKNQSLNNIWAEIEKKIPPHLADYLGL